MDIPLRCRKIGGSPEDNYKDSRFKNGLWGTGFALFRKGWYEEGYTSGFPSLIRSVTTKTYGGKERKEKIKE